MVKNYGGELMGHGPRILSEASLGPNNIGNFGPNSAREAAMVHDLARPEVIAPPADDSECMDDRNKGRKLQLAGNRAVSEVVSSLLNPASPAESISRTIPRKASELKAMGRIPHFHEACAAIGVLADGSVLRYIGENMSSLKPVALEWLRPLVDVSQYTDEDFDAMQRAAQERGAQEELFDATPEEVVKLVRQDGAPVVSFATGHNNLGHRIDTTENSYNNEAFMSGHRSDDDQPMGVMSVTLGLYKKQLEDDGFDAGIVAEELLGATIFNAAVLKMAEPEDVPGVIVG